MLDHEQFILILSHGSTSIRELSAYCRSKGIGLHIAGNTQFFCLASLKADPKSMIQDLGGTYRMAKVVASFDPALMSSEQHLDKTLDELDILENHPSKRYWVLNIFANGYHPPFDTERLEGYLTKRIELEGWEKCKKIVGPPLTSDSTREIRTDEIIRKDALEFVLSIFRGKAYLGRTLSISDHHGFLRRDLERPFQNPKITLPPRIARIMVNLSMVNDGGLLLDPFCGIGTILQEALVRRMNVVGLDILPSRVQDALANLRWLSSLGVKGGFKVSVGDATHLETYFKPESIDGIATEPILLPPTRKPPEAREAHRQLSSVKKTYEKSLAQMAKVLKPGGRVVIVTPMVKLRDGKKATFALEHTSKAGLMEDIGQPMIIEERSQIVCRKIQVFVKRN